MRKHAFNNTNLLLAWWTGLLRTSQQHKVQVGQQHTFHSEKWAQPNQAHGIICRRARLSKENQKWAFYALILTKPICDVHHQNKKPQKRAS
jgi:trehalose/maltose hydrolase-like predicted phosphorylase